jgi:shikimate dehydrogenase
MGFIGVSTGGSSIVKVFPPWCEILGLDAELFGIDVPLAAEPAQIREALLALRESKNCLGALVTTHKINCYRHGFDLFESFDDFASLCGEVSSVKVRQGKMYGAAKDPISAGKSLEEFLVDNHFAAGGEVLCFGDGGAATAIGWYLASRKDAPKKMTFLGVSEEKLSHLSKVVQDKYPKEKLSLALYQPELVAELMQSLPMKSLIINATGMGKDLPGSPVPAGVEFSQAAVVWELNYRGSLEFLNQAKSQAVEKNLQVEDGWRYFIHGWTQVIADVFELNLTSETINKLAITAEQFR